jgi:hypothetical protein
LFPRAQLRARAIRSHKEESFRNVAAIAKARS